MTTSKRLSIRAFISYRQIERIEILARLQGFTEDDLAHWCHEHYDAALPALRREEARHLIADLDGSETQDTYEVAS